MKKFSDINEGYNDQRYTARVDILDSDKFDFNPYDYKNIELQSDLLGGTRSLQGILMTIEEYHNKFYKDTKKLRKKSDSSHLMIYKVYADLDLYNRYVAVAKAAFDQLVEIKRKKGNN